MSTPTAHRTILQLAGITSEALIEAAQHVHEGLASLSKANNVIARWASTARTLVKDTTTAIHLEAGP